MLKYIALDCQSNDTIHLFTDHPRKELLDRQGKKSAARMYINSKDGSKTFHIGWIIGGRWFEVYSVCHMRVETRRK